MIAFIGMETSGALRRRLQARGIETYSCDILPSKDGGEEMAYSSDNRPLGRHLVGDVFETLDHMWANDLWPDLAIFHPTCTYLTGSAAWAFNDPDFERYPEVGYHQKVKPGTLTGAERREARDKAVADVRLIAALPIRRKAIENPIGSLSSMFRKPDQIVQPNWFGDDASKSTCFWLWDLPKLKPTKRVPGRIVEWPRGSGKMVERWSNQTEGGQNCMTPSDDRWQKRSETYAGIADAIAEQWGSI